jgi:uncharacterized cupin superfamily protein
MAGMPRVNLTDPPFELDPDDPDGYRAGMCRLGAAFGARESGATLYELAPGQAVCPYHYEYAEEEWALVLSGTPTLRTPAGVEQLVPLDLTYFPTGPSGAHQLRNDGDETVRVLLWSTVRSPAVTAYPDSDKVGIFTGIEGEDVMARRADSVGYYDGETGRA